MSSEFYLSDLYTPALEAHFKKHKSYSGKCKKCMIVLWYHWGQKNNNGSHDKYLYKLLVKEGIMDYDPTDPESYIKSFRKK